MTYQRLALAVSVLFALCLFGCGESAPLTAKAILKNPQGETVGEARLMETPQGVKIELKAEKLPPGVHAFHIHEKGLCSPPDFADAGGHFNPFGKEHGLENPKGPHAGDLPNITVGPDGQVTFETVATLVTLKPGKNSLFQPGGTSLMIHAHADDMVSDPAGHAGPRIACGAIVK